MIKMAIVDMDDDDRDVTLADCPEDTICLMSYDSDTSKADMQVADRFSSADGSAGAVLGFLRTLFLCCGVSIKCLSRMGITSVDDDRSFIECLDSDDDD